MQSFQELRRTEHQPSGRRLKSRDLRISLAATLAMIFAAGTAQAQSGVKGTQAASDAEQPHGRSDEIVVTAQRRSQSIQDVPYNISAISPASLGASGAVNTNDLGRVVVGLGTVDEGPGSRSNQNNFTLRGLRTDDPGSTAIARNNVNSVSTYFGETPVFFTLLLKDLERVEVLRGPQGTLYGSGAQGGTIRFIPKRPSFDRISGEINASAGYTQRAGRLNNAIDGMINLPLADNLALRLVGAVDRQAGFIDGVNRFQLGPDNVPVPSVPGDLASGPVLAPIDQNANNSLQWMARASLRYQPTDWLDLELNYLHQETRADDGQSANVTFQGGPVEFGDFPNASFEARPGGKYRSTAPIREPYKNKIDLFSGTGIVDLDFASLTSVTSYYKSSSDSIVAPSGAYFPAPGFSFLAVYGFYPRFYPLTDVNVTQKGLVQEVRLVSTTSGPLSYVVGLYYEDLRQNFGLVQTLPGVQEFALSQGFSSATPELGDTAWINQQNSRSSDKAVFGEITYRLTPKWQITGGFRFFKDKVSVSFAQDFPFAASPVDADATQRVSSQVFKLNTAYDFSEETKIYMTYSRGFRRGGANGLPLGGFYASLPEFLTYAPDYADNYEVGLKGSLIDRRLRYSLSAYWIELKDFQFSGVTPSFLSATFNGDSARSRGVEFEAQFRVSSALDLSFGYTYTDAKTTGATQIVDLAPGALLFTDPPETQVGTVIRDGLRLPGVSKHVIIGALDYHIPLASSSSITLHADGNYRSGQQGVLDVTSVSFWVIPDQFMANLRATYDSGKNWSISAFVTNVTDALGYTGGGALNERTPNIFASRGISRPRTAGAAMSFKF